MRTVILVWCLVGVFVTLHRPCSAKSYSVEEIRVDATVTSDGELRITEHITYHFRGSFSYAFREIPLQPGEHLRDVRVRDGGVEYQRSGENNRGTFSVTATGDRSRITWYYAANNERRTFLLSYVMTGAVHRFPDITEIYYKFVGDEWDRPIGRATVDIRLPESIDASDIRAWAHGPLYGSVRIAPPAIVSLSVEPLPARTYWEARVVCPAEAFEGLTLSGERARLETILAEEGGWAEEANRLRQRQRQKWEAASKERQRRAVLARRYLPFSFALGVLALAVWFHLFRRHGWPYSVTSRTPRGEIPSDHPPAMVSYLMNRMVSGPAIVATLLDLANRGYLEIRETVSESTGWFGKTKTTVDYRFDVVARPLSELEPFERDLLRFMLNEAGDSTGFSMLDLRKRARKNRGTFQKWFRAWVREVRAYGKTLQFYEPYPVGAMVFNGLCGALIMVVGMFLSVSSEVHVGIPAIAGGFSQAVLTAFLNRRTSEGKRLMLAWRDFRSHLKQISKALGPVTLDSSEWGRYLSAAIVFGMHKKLIRNLRVTDGGETVVCPVWFYPGAGGAAESSIADLASGFSTMVDAVTTTMSSASGTGGGASAGGGGGSGGGGGGAG